MATTISLLVRPVVAFSPHSIVTRRFSGWVGSSSLNSKTIQYSSTSSDEDGKITAVDENDALSEYRNKGNLRDQVFSAISKDGGVKVTAATIRNAVNDMMIQHEMNAVSADVLGRTVTCGLLMSNGIQAEQTVQITLNTDGPIRGVVAIATGKGELKGYVGAPALGDMHIKEAIGKGYVQIVKNHPDWPNPYNGITQVQHGDVDRDIGIYLAESEQRTCALAAATSVNGILCTAAGGYLIEQLPGVESETMDIVASNLAKLVEMDGGDTLPTGLLHKGVTPLEIAEIILDGLDMQPLQQIEPGLTCECSEDKLVRALQLLSKEDVDDILEKEEQIEARCQFCGKVYRMGPDEVAKRFEASRGDPSKDSEYKPSGN
eukprot:CAMPEP_0195284034 /NCGR_PEP_ID=MMETSP0707-20130614/2387_1 /TAXON_ID=33640 /ORGANISM="Asterionellopsis glacialis, Strain CCMP134" /LENGTH=374 /DNA_ID=CAMNT_0040343327 /DNA_START=151 /DNA_END=1275 /DNA_ORIENTATION=+